MSKRKKKKRTKKCKRVLFKLGITDERLTSRGGLLVVDKLLEALRIEQQADGLLPRLNSNRSYHHSTIVKAFVLMLNEGGKCLEDVYHLHSEHELLKFAGMAQVPGADTLARWLRGNGEAGVPQVHQLSRTVIAKTLDLLRVKRITLDIDATAILNNKAGAQWTYLGQRGFMPIIGTVAESGQVIAIEFRAGNVPPNYDNEGFIKTCQAQLPAGAELRRVRSDAAGYKKNVIDDLTQQNIEFVIRARMDSATKALITSVAEAEWQPLRRPDGSLSPHEWVARRTHTMHHSNTVFDVVIQRTVKSEVFDLPEQRELPGLSIPTYLETDRYIYRMVATNIQSLDDSRIIQEYNQRGECSENRIKELKLDFAGGRLPCSDFGANALYVCMCALAYNVFALLRAGLPPEFRFARAMTMRVRLFALAAKIVQHGRQWTLKLHKRHYQLLSKVFARLDDTLGEFLPKMRYPLLH